MLKLPKKLEDLILWLMVAGVTGTTACSKKGPSSPNETPTDPQGLVIETETTNVEGAIEFSTGKPARLQNESGQPIANSPITYFTDGEYHAFMTPEGEYFSSFSISGSAGTDTLTLKNKTDDECDVRITRNQELSDLLFKFSKDLLEANQDRGNCNTYDRTTSGECALGAYSIVDGILLYIGLEWVVSIAGNVLELIGHTDGLEFEEYLRENNWDHYILTDVVLDDPPITTDLHLRYPSNQPYLSRNEVEVDGRTARVRMRVSDRSVYENPQHGVIEDATIPCLGPTSSSDIWYQFDLIDGDGNQLDTVVSTDSHTFYKDYTNLPPGEYSTMMLYLDDTFWTWSEDAPLCNGYNGQPERTEFTIE